MRELYETRTVHSPQSINILYYILYHLTSFSSSYSPREEILCNSPQSVSTVVWKVSCVLSLPLEKVRWKKMEIMELSTTSGILSFEISHFFTPSRRKCYLQSQPRKKLWTFFILAMSGSSLDWLLSSSLVWKKLVQVLYCQVRKTELLHFWFVKLFLFDCWRLSETRQILY